MNITAVKKTCVAIRPLPLEDDGIIKHTEQTREAMMKRQNKGEVVVAGESCEFCETGDIVSFYRNAATPLKSGEEELLIVEECHVLAKFI